MELEIEYDLSDWKNFQEFFGKKVCNEARAWWDSMWVNAAIWIVVALVYYAFARSGTDFSWPTAFIVIFFLLLIFGFLVLNGVKMRQAVRPSQGGIFLRRHKFQVNDDGIAVTSAGYEAKYDWTAVRAVEKTDNAIYLFIDSVNAFIFPLSKVGDANELMSVIERNVTSR